MASAVREDRVLSLINRCKGGLLRLSPHEASFARRGFPGHNSKSREHLERIIGAFIDGYNLAVREQDSVLLTEHLDSSFPPAFVGFAYEGTGLYFGLMDLLLPRRESRLAAFTRSTAPRHDFIISVGAGFALARVPFGLWRLPSYRRRLDPMTSWCLADGYGFHQGFFHWKRFIVERAPAPERFDLQERRLFDAGVGRAMWWVYGADPESIANAISRFDRDRQPEMWVGIGTALAYAGGGPPMAPAMLAELAGEYRHDLLSGIPFAAHMREKGGNPAEWTGKACQELLGMPVSDASSLIVSELANFFASWSGSEQDKWNRCYIELRDRVKWRLSLGCNLPKAPASFTGARITAGHE